MQDSPSSIKNTTTYFHESSIKRREKETKEPAVSQQVEKKGKNIKFYPEEVTSLRKQVTRSTTKRNLAMHTSQAPEEEKKNS
jgi:hypothetical protein